MRFRTMFVLAVALAACKSKPNATPATDPVAACDLLAKGCGDNEKHVTAIADACKQAAPAPACVAKVSALYDCYQTQLCGKSDRVWAFADLAVLAQRKSVCAAEQKAVTECK